ncbi:MAG TPA: matrixin family metalloprotease, partial [Planctomycetota bacterium]|nr:matrixin family metalloprotease [Planctomycetota bacterium]
MIRTAGLAALLGGSFLTVAALSWPVATAAYTVGDEHLDLAQRDVRVVNSFADPEANDNVVAQAVFPGTLGAPLALRKAHVEWSSGPWAGTGEGDGLASNPVLGSGNANFDNSWQGVAAAAGSNENVHIAMPGSSGSTLAFTVSPVSDGWEIIYYDTWLWDDGPGAPVAGALDLQSIATHEIGHVLGLGHTSVPGQTMSPTITGNGTDARSIEFDDVAGLQAIYGVESPSKPRIEAVSPDHVVGATFTITGVNFAATGNEVWFTNVAASGEPVKVTGVASTGGGQLITLTVPQGAAAGEILVRTSGLDDGSVLSNAFPFDVPVGLKQLQPGFSSVGGAPPLLTATGDAAPGGSFTLQLSGGPS